MDDTRDQPGGWSKVQDYMPARALQVPQLSAIHARPMMEREKPAYAVVPPEPEAFLLDERDDATDGLHALIKRRAPADAPVLPLRASPP